MVVDGLLVVHLMYAVAPFLWYLSILHVSLTHLPYDFFTSHFRGVPQGVYRRGCCYFIQFLAAESPLGSMTLKLDCEITVK